MRTDLTGSQSLGLVDAEREHDLIHLAQAALPFPAITGSNVPARSRGTSIPMDRAESVRSVFSRVPLRMLPHLTPDWIILSITQMPGHFLIQGCLDHRLGELFEQPIRAC